MIGNYRFEGHALVSADDRIADADGMKPAALNHPADWARFQAELGKAALILIGRKSHETDPGRPGRRRLVVSTQATGVEKRADAWWWNPAIVSVEEALTTAAPGGGLVAIPGGHGVFDLFLGIGYDAFHLARLGQMVIPGGIPVFSACAEGIPAESVLTTAGLRQSESEVLDGAAALTSTVWRR